MTERCELCGGPAAEYDPYTDACYCGECALALAERRWLSKRDGDKLDDMGFETINEYGRG